tara:strand:- start:1324 stop:1467 length:144 start_codon:yes stop_codon:yes gene_type:complete
MPIRVLSAQRYQLLADSQFLKHKTNALPGAMVTTVDVVAALTRPETD